MNDNVPKRGQLGQIEQRLRRGLQHEAARWERSEPARLAAACRTVPRAKNIPARRRHVIVWASAAVACAVLLVCSISLWQCRSSAPRPPTAARPPQAQVDVQALYAALPKIPPPTTPPPPVTLVPDIVIVQEP